MSKTYEKVGSEKGARLTESKAIWAMPIWKQHISKRAPLRGMTMTLDMSKVFTTLVQVVTSSRQNSPSCSPNLDSSPGAKRSRWYTPSSSIYNVIELLFQASQFEEKKLIEALLKAPLWHKSWLRHRGRVHLSKHHLCARGVLIIIIA